ncbi:ABC transporter ATP-binding protein [Afifella marina]|uniref:Putative ABC transport system ATP-binding protein n=1 Tax=Afifella marina DSM 2698 TaxID=1120955 RepID=A0A1G5NQN6_AFIMA|nr:ABC transporter ATP-binding protein [Afifella marina]SCZ39645.1 putative ABC transport system ATP-binding protein [Afifella marina DSM 2698]
MREPAILIDGAELTLGAGRSQVHVLRQASLVAAPGEMIGLIGPSGSGKSTLLMVVAGLERVDRGRVAVAGRDYSEMDEDALAAFRGDKIGFVFQAFHLMQTMTALENVAVPLELAGKSDAFARAEKMLARVGLGERLSHYPAALSGGEQQRVAIARALVTEPAILIADEPTGNLDEDTGREIADLLFETVREHATTLLLVTHDRALAERCDRTVRIASGHIEPVSGTHTPPARERAVASPT